MAVRVKICGITRAQDARLAAHLGASAVGFVMWPGSPRRVDADVVRAISRELPPFVARVGVFVDASPEEVSEAVRRAGLDVAQLHGRESVSDYADVPARLIKSVTLQDGDDVDRAAELPVQVTPLVDAPDAIRRGGTGRTADWTLAGRLAARRPILLAGGLSAENLADAIRQVNPWGVDVSSGVETEPGIKSPGRLAAFLAAAVAGEGRERS